MENIEIILSLIGTAIGLTITALTFLTKFLKNSKARKLAEQAAKIGEAVLPYIQEAEKFVSYSGAEKKAYVMTKANRFAITNKLSFCEREVSEKVEEIVALTKQVNAKSFKAQQASEKAEQHSQPAETPAEKEKSTESPTKPAESPAKSAWL